MLLVCRIASAAGLFTVAALFSGCNKQNDYVPPPPPKVDVALPLKQTVTPYLNATGNTAAVNTTTLVARVAGFIQEIDYHDGDEVKAGTKLFVIEPEPYELALEQAQAGQTSAAAASKQSGADLKRQQDLFAQKVVPASAVDQANAAAAANAAKQQQSAVDVKQAQLNLSYTEVKAPFDGVVTARQVSIGQFVGTGSGSNLATIVQMAPIYVNFSISERDVQRIRAEMARRGLTARDLKKLPVEIGLQSETGYPHKGTLDYAAPEVDPSTGTLAVRAVLDNQDKALLPGYFVRLRIPLGEQPDMLLVPDRALGSDQGGFYLLVAGKDDTVEQRSVQIGQLVGDMRVITSGIAADDRVVVSGLLTAVPGQKIEPEVRTLEAPKTDGAAQ